MYLNVICNGARLGRSVITIGALEGLRLQVDSLDVNLEVLTSRRGKVAKLAQEILDLLVPRLVVDLKLALRGTGVVAQRALVSLAVDLFIMTSDVDLEENTHPFN